MPEQNNELPKPFLDKFAEFCLDQAKLSREYDTVTSFSKDKIDQERSAKYSNMIELVSKELADAKPEERPVLLGEMRHENTKLLRSGFGKYTFNNDLFVEQVLLKALEIKDRVVQEKK
ncbi:MAG: hypothetical protein HW400_697 [Candidatus Levybacteria bacterium]|nr:hypothetical protein [Candidatus Levybacteria bacterium]